MEEMVPQIKEQYLDLVNQINEINAQLDPESAGRTKVLQAASQAATEKVNPVLEQFNTFLTTLTDEERVGVLYTFQRTITKDHKEFIDKFVDENKTEQTAVTGDEAKQLEEKREAATKKARAAMNFLETFGVEFGPGKDLPKVPQRLRGKGKGTGKRLAGTFAWTVNGDPVTGSRLGDLMKKAEADSVDSIRQAIINQYGENFDWKNPPKRLTFPLTVEKDEKKVTVQVVGLLSEDDTDTGDSDDEPEVEVTDEVAEDFEFEDQN